MTALENLERFTKVVQNKQIEYPGLDIRLELRPHGLEVRLRSFVLDETFDDYAVVSWVQLSDSTLLLVLLETVLEGRIHNLRSAVKRKLAP